MLAIFGSMVVGCSEKKRYSIYCEGPLSGVLGYSGDDQLEIVWVEDGDSNIQCAFICEGTLRQGDFKAVDALMVNGVRYDVRPYIGTRNVYKLRPDGKVDSTRIGLDQIIGLVTCRQRDGLKGG